MVAVNCVLHKRQGIGYTLPTKSTMQHHNHPREARVYNYWILLCHSQSPDTAVLIYLLLPQKD